VIQILTCNIQYIFERTKMKVIPETHRTHLHLISMFFFYYVLRRYLLICNIYTTIKQSNAKRETV